MSEVLRYSDLAGTTKVGETDYTYDDSSRLKNINHQNGSSTTLAELTYTYDLASRTKTETIGSTTKTFVYDVTNQLTDDGVNTYSYDANGNRNMAGYQTGTGNQMTNDGTWTYTYDAEGNTTKKSKGAALETWTYLWDHRNRITSIEQRDTDGGTLQLKVEYEYDVFGRRIQEDKWTSATGTVTTRFAYDGDNTWVEMDDTNSLVTRYVRPDGIDSLAARVDSGYNVAWYLTDRLGSVIGLTNGSGVVQDRITYDGFGVITNETNASFGGDIKFTGRDRDSDTGDQHNRAREYDPTTGRWRSRDPIGFDGGDNNLYRYVANSTTNATDPTGLLSYDDFSRVQGKWIKAGKAYLKNEQENRRNLEPDPQGLGPYAWDIKNVLGGRLILIVVAAPEGASAFIEYEPDNDNHCKEITFLQVVTFSAVVKGFATNNPRHTYLWPGFRGDAPFFRSLSVDRQGDHVDILPDDMDLFYGADVNEKGRLVPGTLGSPGNGAYSYRKAVIGAPNKARKKPAFMWDAPKSPRDARKGKGDVIQYFETAVFCRDTQQILGVARWGYRIPDTPWGSRYTRVSASVDSRSNGVSPEFKALIAKANAHRQIKHKIAQPTIDELGKSLQSSFHPESVFVQEGEKPPSVQQQLQARLSALPTK